MTFVRTDLLKTNVHRRAITNYTDSRYGKDIITNTSSSSFNALGQRDIYSDPDWRIKVAKGQDASQPYSSYGYRKVKPPRLHSSWSWRDTRPNGGIAYGDDSRIGGLYSFPMHVPSLDSQYKSLALQRLKQKLNSQLNRRNQLIPTVELRETRALIRGVANETLTYLYNVARLLGSKNLLAAAKYGGPRFKEQFQRLWLTYSFGIAPTLGDIQDLLEQINEILNPVNPKTERLAGSATKLWTSDASHRTTGFYSWLVDSRCRIGHQLSYRYVAGINLDILSANNYGLADQFQTTPRDLPSVGWELTPFSWIFDYFTNIGQFLDDTFVSPPGFTKFVVCTTRYRVTVVEDLSYHYNPTVANEVATLSPSSSQGLYEFVRIDREVLDSLPHVGLHMKTSDQMTNNLVSKLLNMSSLLRSGRPLNIN